MKTTSTSRVRVESGGDQVVGSVGLHALGSFADRLGLGSALSSQFLRFDSRLLRDRGKVLVHGALTLSGGGDNCADIEYLRSSERLFGSVPSDSTFYRTMREISPSLLAGLKTALSSVRTNVWRRSTATTGLAPVVLDFDATLVEIHSEFHEQHDIDPPGGPDDNETGRDHLVLGDALVLGSPSRSNDLYARNSTGTRPTDASLNVTSPNQLHCRSAGSLTSMKCIGLLGGMSWESTALYYQLLNEGIRDRLGGLHSARCVIHSVDFAEIEQLQHQDRWDEAGQLLATCAQGIEAAGADVLLICTNTMHMVADQVQAATNIPLLHLADATAIAVKQAGIDRVGLLGTAFTMEKAFYKDRLASHDITVDVPDDTDRQLVHRVIYEELCLGVINESSRTKYLRIIDKLVAGGAQGIVAGCTEIELLVKASECPVPLFPTTRLHVDAAIELALENAQ